jgi:Zn-finger nucleic acid-binding protein
MECPVCKVTLLMSEKQGVEIDYCPSCRGVWLDRGELEKIIEKSYSQPPVQPDMPLGDNDYYKRKYDHDGHDSHGYKYGRKRNLLSELFD